MTNRKRKRRKERAAQVAKASRDGSVASIDAIDDEEELLEGQQEDSADSEELDEDDSNKSKIPPGQALATAEPVQASETAAAELPTDFLQNISDPRHMVEILNRVFSELDKNHDNVLSRPEVDMAVIDRFLTAEDSAGVSVLKSCFEEIKDLHKEGWFARKNGVTLADLLAFEQILLMESQAAEREDHEKMRELVRITTRHAARALRAHKKLYTNMDEPEKSIRPEAIRQGIVGDCYFLAALASIASTNPALIKWMITPLEDHYYQVVFAGCMEAPVVVPEPTPVELALYAKVGDYGMWPAVIEKAYGIFLQQHSARKVIIPATAADAAESVYEAFDLLTGQMGHWEALPLLSSERFKALLDSAFKEHRAVAAATQPGKSGYTQDAKLPAQHAFSVLGWNSRKEEITLRNPWGRVSEMCSIFENADGIFTISVNTFRRNFIALYYEDWAPDESIDDGELPI